MTEAVGDSELSRREIEVCRLVAEGMTNRKIGRYLGISEKTVETYLRRTFTKTGIRSRAQVGTMLKEAADHDWQPTTDPSGDDPGL